MDDWHLSMDSTRNQQTIAIPVAVTGFGYWSGQDVRVEFRPAAPDSGVVFVRGDLTGFPRIPARIAARFEAARRTCLGTGEVRVEMVEHVLAALSGLRIDNCEVWVDQPELPGCDGSAQPFVAALDGAGRVLQAAVRPRRVVRTLIRRQEGEAWIEARPVAGEVSIGRYQLDYGPNSPIGQQAFETALTPAAFRSELAPCRTFMLKAEADWLVAQGLGLRAAARDLLVYGPQGPIDNQERFPDECARHKLMDLLGDLALSGCELIGRFSAYRSGHRLNAELVRALLEETELEGVRRRCA